jgi:AhpD family alkylhydroperoxidase
MSLRMTKELDKIFETCSSSTLSPKVTNLVALACQLAAGCDRECARESVELAAKSGASHTEINRVACMCACTAGPKVQDTYAAALRSFGELSPSLENARTLDSGAGSQPVQSLDSSLFHRLCKKDTLDRKTTHLVGLAACLAAGCDCARGHTVAARQAGATEQELARCACVAACVSGIAKKYTFLAALQSVEHCKACVC